MIVIDLAKLRTVTGNEAEVTIDVGRGCIYKDVDEEVGSMVLLPWEGLSSTPA